MNRDRNALLNKITSARRDVVEGPANLDDVRERVKALESWQEQITSLLAAQGFTIGGDDDTSGGDTTAPDNRTLPKKSLERDARRIVQAQKAKQEKFWQARLKDGK